MYNTLEIKPWLPRICMLLENLLHGDHGRGGQVMEVYNVKCVTNMAMIMPAQCAITILQICLLAALQITQCSLHHGLNKGIPTKNLLLYHQFNFNLYGLLYPHIHDFLQPYLLANFKSFKTNSLCFV